MILGWVFGAGLLVLVLWDAFETIVLPRRVTRRIRLTALFYRVTWRPWRALALRIRKPKRRDAFLSYYGPLSTLGLLALWAVAMVLAFALMQWALGSRLNTPEHAVNFWVDLYVSGTTLFTVGLGDVTPATPGARALTAIEGGLGFAFLALVIGYLPVLYGAFSRREVSITLMDARAGSPSSAVELLSHYGRRQDRVENSLRELEHWTAELLESHISYPMLSFFRSQHDNQSWLTVITTILDSCAVVIAGIESGPVWQAELTFAIARHAVVDISQILKRAPQPPEPDRLPPSDLARLRERLAEAGLEFSREPAAERILAEMRAMYEPYVNALSHFLAMPLPPWLGGERVRFNWRTSAWGTAQPPSREVERDDEHYY